MTQQPNRSGQDLVGDFQRWLVRSGARSMSREVSDQLRSVLGQSGGHADVWERATTTPAGEAPECAWCPLCRAARMVRESGPGMASQAAAVGDTVVALVQDTLSAFESALAAAGKTARPGTGPARAGTVWADVTAQDPEEEPESQDPEEEPEATAPPGGPPHEPDDRG